MRIRKVYEKFSDTKVQDELENFLSMLETEFSIEELGHFASSNIEYNKRYINIYLNFVVLADDELKKIAEIKIYFEGCLDNFLIRPVSDSILECYFGIEYNEKFRDIINELKMKSDAKKYNL
jgi:hypothetical protein